MRESLFPGQLKPREIPPAEKPEEREFGTEANKKENDREFSELVLSARKEAERILREALRERQGGNTKRDLELEKEAYRIFLALDILGVEIPESIGNAVHGQLEKSGIVGFASEKSAENFFRELVGTAQREEKVEAA